MNVLAGKAEVDDIMSLSAGVSSTERAARVYLITVTDGLSANDLTGLDKKVYPFCKLQQVIDDVIAERPDYKFAIITHGAEILPYLQEQHNSTCIISPFCKTVGAINIFCFDCLLSKALIKYCF